MVMMRFILFTLASASILFHVHADSGPFEANLQKRVNREDDLLNQALFPGSRHYSRKDHTLKPRVITYRLQNRKRTTFQALIGLPTCLKCAGKRKFDAELSYDEFTAAKMVNKIIPGGNNGDCLFYGQREETAKPTSLSVQAAKLACLMVRNPFRIKRVRAIWHMWPQDDKKNCEVEQNYYCLNAWEPDCCWLNPLMPGDSVQVREPKTRPYFQQMSLAMALTCTGEVFILHDKPDNLNYEPAGKPTSIWITHELPALKRLYKGGIVTKLTAIAASEDGSPKSLDSKDWLDATDTLKQPLKRELEWTEDLAQLVKARKEYLRSEAYDNATVHASLEERWGLCPQSAADQEDPHLDYFG